MKYKILIIILKAICIPCVYIMSYYCFSGTNMFKLMRFLFSSDTQAFLIVALITMLVFLLLKIIKGNADVFIFLVCALFCITAAAGYSKMNWISRLVYYIIHMSVTFQTYIPAKKVTAICILVVSGCIIIWFASRWGKEFDTLISDGIRMDEIICVSRGRTVYFLLVFTIVWLSTAAFYMVLQFFELFFISTSISLNISPALIALTGVIPFIALLYLYLRKRKNLG